ncbi:MAG: GNAT family N-acetyltransferase [Alphaproteobacteria bacterium]|nr:GNAT family N-acetyltransferase [Alphaproteobacteria bacterium]
MASPVFTEPHENFAASFVAALREGLHLHIMAPEKIERVEKDFAGWLRDEQDMSRPVELPDGTKVQRIPQTTRWLVNDGNFIGVVNVRHSLSEHLRREGGHIGYAVRASERCKGYGRLLINEGLRVARELGHDRALITCNDDNIGSIRLIEGAGGVLEDKIMPADADVLRRRYWVQL